MATTTPNYLWVVPTSSDLVKNGATAIETLGDSADASLWNSGFGQAGKNKIINGDFGINQRAFTSVTADATFTFDRFFTGVLDGTVTFTPQVFTPGAAPEAGYEATNFLRIVTTGQTLTTAQARISQRIEDVRTFAGQTVTVSFYAKASTGTPSVGINVSQTFGSGGSASVNVNGQKTAITTAWVRYSKTFSVPSISGKTIGTGSTLRLNLWTSAGSTNDTASGTLGIQSATIDIWGVQVEYGSYATPFQTASGGSPQSELAMCQRYYYRISAASTGSNATCFIGNGNADSTTRAIVNVPFPVQMRTAPTTLDSSTLGLYDGVTVTAVTSVSNAFYNCNVGGLQASVASGLTQYRPYSLIVNNSATGYLGFSAEL
jgi:hypothetical protein